MVTKKIKKGTFSLILLSILLVLSGCQVLGLEEDETTVERIQREGVVTVGFANEQPYAYQTVEGELTGSAVEVARQIMENLGVNEMEGVLTEFASLIPGLQAERFDMVTAGMFITPDRAAANHIQFANPEYTIGQAIAVDEGNPLDLHSYEDIAENDEATVSVPSGTVEYDFLLDVGVPEDRIITVPDMPAALSALQAGRADVITATGPSLQSVLDTAGDDSIERVEDFTQPVIGGEEVINYGATVFREVDEDFIEAFNEELANLQESGELLEIIQEFGFTEEDLPGDATVEDAVEDTPDAAM